MTNLPLAASIYTFLPPSHFEIQPYQLTSSSHSAVHYPGSRKRSSLISLCSSSLSGDSYMDSTSGPALYPLHRCKTLHLVRHAQGHHNVAAEKNHDEYMSEDYFDAALTPLGWQQVDNLHKHVLASGLLKKIELVIVSPLMRTMQTAVGVFGGGDCTDGVDIHPLMSANAGDSDRSAISSLNCPPFISVELCRELLGVHPCDRRRSITQYQRLFPAIDFSPIENNEDVLWKADIREKNEEVIERGIKFLNWILTREEKEIAVVSHSGFLYRTLSAFGNDCHPSVKSEITNHMSGSNISTTNYPGKIPDGLDLPSDAVKEENARKLGQS